MSYNGIARSQDRVFLCFVGAYTNGVADGITDTVTELHGRRYEEKSEEFVLGRAKRRAKSPDGVTDKKTDGVTDFVMRRAKRKTLTFMREK